MICTMCGRDLSSDNTLHQGTVASVSISINGQCEQSYCGSPLASDDTGLSCWQHAIEAWHRLIMYDQAIPNLKSGERPLPVRSTNRSHAEQMPA